MGASQHEEIPNDKRTREKVLDLCWGGGLASKKEKKKGVFP